MTEEKRTPYFIDLEHAARALATIVSDWDFAADLDQEATRHSPHSLGSIIAAVDKKLLREACADILACFTTEEND